MEMAWVFAQGLTTILLVGSYGEGNGEGYVVIAGVVSGGGSVGQLSIGVLEVLLLLEGVVEMELLQEDMSMPSSSEIPHCLAARAVLMVIFIASVLAMV